MKPPYCENCSSEAPVVESDIGWLCLECAADHLNIPLSQAQKEAACGICRSKIRDVPLLFKGHYYHDRCIRTFFVGQRCPKCQMDKMGAGGFCPCGWTVDRLVEQAEKDALSALIHGKLCSQCLKFNASTSMGLPLMPSEPWPAETVCSECSAPICSKHAGQVAKDNVLEIDPKKNFCTGGWISSCYGDLEEKVQCSVRDCYYRESRNWECNACKAFYRSFRPTGRSPDELGTCQCYDPLTEAGQCDNCENYFCNEDHDKCPDCIGVSCDDCGEATPQDELRPFGGYYNPDMICADCHSSKTCSYCGEEMSDDEQGSYGGYCEYCAVKHDDYVKCDDCGSVVPEDEAHQVEDEVLCNDCLDD